MHLRTFWMAAIMVIALTGCGGGGGSGSDPSSGGNGSPGAGDGQSTTLKISRFGQGQIQDAGASINCGSASCTHTVPRDTQLQLEAQPAQGWAFSHWVGCDVVTAGRCQVSMTRERSVHPYFTRTTPVRLHSNVVVLNAANLARLVRREMSLFVFEGTADQVQSLQVGSILVSTAGEGFARRVTGVNVLNGGLIYVNTRDASVEEVVSEGTLIARGSDFRIAAAATNDRRQIQAQTTVSISLQDADGRNGVTGTLELQVDPDVAMDFDLGGLNEFKFIVDARIKPSVSFKANEPIGREYEKKLFERPFSPVTVGPLVIVPTLSATAKASLTLNLAAQLGGQFEATGAAGTHWIRGRGQTTVGRLASDAGFDLVGNLADDASIEAALGLEIKSLMKIYGVSFGPYVAATGGATAKVVAAVSRDNSCPFRLVVEADGSLKVGGEADVLGQKFDINATVTSFPTRKFVDIAPERCPDTEAPTTPGTPTVSAVSPGELKVQWAPSTDRSKFVAYEVSRNGVVVASTGSAAFSDAGLAADTEYCYTVVAVDRKGNRSPASPSACGRTPRTTPPSGFVPSSVQAQALTGTAVRLTWAPDPTQQATKYIVTLGGLEVGRTSSTTFDVVGLTRDTKYCFVVTAVNAGGKSTGSAPVCTRTRALAQWRMQIRCVEQDYYVVTQELDLDTQSREAVNVFGNALDYSGVQMAYHVSGQYDTPSGRLEGRILWSFEGSSNIREDVFALTLSRNDTGNVEMRQVQVTGCQASVRFVRLY